MTSPQAVVSAENLDRVLVEIPVANIHPDPKQPRLHPDDELAASIKAQGILQPFSVERLQILDDVCPDCGLTFAELEAIGDQYMINDGERRWRGAVGAGLKVVDVFVVQPTTSGKRLLRQVTSNTGKPLTAIEEALAYKSIMEEEGWTQAELARNLGKPKSLVGDRIRLIELDAVWLDAISSGKLQVSHAPVLSTWSVVPSEYQAKAAKNLFDDYRYKRFEEGKGTLPVDELPRLLRVAFRDYIKPMDRCPGYRGPTVKIKREYGGGVETFAADIKLWRPFAKKYEARHRKALQSNAGSSYRPRVDKTIEKLETLPKRKASTYHPEANKGEVMVYEAERGWTIDGIPEVFLAKVDPAKLVRVFAEYRAGIATTDLAAVAAAKAALDDRLRKSLESKLAEIRGIMRSKKVEELVITGPGCRLLINSLEKWQNPIPVIALALGLPDPGIDTEDDMGSDVTEKVKPAALTDEQAATLATGYIAVRSGILKVPAIAAAKDEVLRKLLRTPFKLAPAGADGAPVESKKARKRAARAAGKQVGDPSRAPKQELAAAGV